MALLEIWTVSLERSRLDRIIAAARVRKSFRILTRELTVVTLRGTPVPELKSYELEPTDEVDLYWHGAVVNQERLTEFLQVKENLRGAASIYTATVDVNESGGHPAEGRYDTKVSFGDDFFGPYMSLDVGSASKGWKNLAYRQGLFQRFLVAIAAAGRVDAFTVAEGALDFRLSPANVAEFRDFAGNEHKQTLEGGGLVVRRAGCYPGRLNAAEITVWDARRDLAAAVLAVIGALGDDCVAGGKVSVHCTRQQYEGVGAVLARSKFAPWEASFMGRSRYDLDSLDDAMAEMESFVLRAFTLKEKGTGTVYVEIWNDRGRLKLLFSAEPQSGPQEEVLHALIAELAGGDNIIDRNKE